MGRIVIVGAGAIGGVLAARLVETGADVVAVARGEHARVMARDGLAYADADRSFVARLPVVEQVGDAHIGADDAVVLCVKGQDTRAVLADLAVCAPRQTPVFCFQNGVANERIVGEAFADVHGAVVMMPASHLRPGQVVAESAPIPGLFDIGRADGGVDHADASLGEALRRAGFDARAVPNVMRWKYTKLLMSVANAVEAMCARDGDAARLAALVRDETLAVYQAAAIDFASVEEEATRRGGLLTIRPVPGFPRGGSSTWQSFARGLGSVEVDAFNGEIARLGAAHGVPTPVNELLLARALAAAATPGFVPASIPAAELLAALDS